MKKLIDEILPEIIRLRHAIHAKPELRYEEKITAQLINEALQQFGYQQIQTEIAGTGIVALIDSGKPGKTVALRADMDALPIIEETQVSYQSQHHGKMHACGHDGHSATLLACAYALLRSTDQFRGKIKLIFQPAEEGGAGAKAMIDEGALENPQVDAIFGYHNWPGMAIGHMGTREQCIFAGVTDFKITVMGKGGHAAIPHLACDPIYIATQLVQSLQSISSRQIDPCDPLVISVTQFISGTASNIIPNTATFAGTIRTATHANRDQVKHKMTQMINEITSAYHASAQIEFEDKCPPTINSAAEVSYVLTSAAEIIGTDNAHHLSAPTMAGEDFSYFLEKIPGCFFLVGNGETSPSLHNSKYNFADEVIPIAAQILCQVACNYLKL